MDALLTAAIYLLRFLALGIAARRWLTRRSVGLSDVQAEGNPARQRRSVFLLGLWRERD